MNDKQFLFYLGGGGNGINFIASLCHYNYYQRNEEIVFSPNGDSHPYNISNGIHRSLIGSTKYEVSNFKVTNIHPGDIVERMINFVYTYITIDTITDLKFTFLNHFLKAQYGSVKRQFPMTDDRTLFENFLSMNEMSEVINNFVIPQECSNMIFDLKFSDIYRDKKKVITFIEELTDTKSSEMLHVNYDRYLYLQKQLLQYKAPWF